MPQVRMPGIVGGVFPKNVDYRPISSHTQNSSLSTVQTLSLPNGANALLIQCTNGNIRYTLDGTTPSSSVGFLIKSTDVYPTLIPFWDGVTFKLIETTASSSIAYIWVRVDP